LYYACIWWLGMPLHDLITLCGSEQLLCWGAFGSECLDANKRQVTWGRRLSSGFGISLHAEQMSACTVRTIGWVVVLSLSLSPLDHTCCSQGKVALRHCHINTEWRVAIADAFASLTQQIVWKMSNRTWRCIELYADCEGIHIDPLDPWNSGVMKGKEVRCSGTYRTLCSMRFGVTESNCL